MILLGVLALVFGGILYFNGNSINNDLDAQMESIFNDGVANPGSSYETFGILLLIIGFVFLIIGVVTRKKEEEAPITKETTKEKTFVCKKCGAIVNPECKFCPHCGGSLLPAGGWLCDCGNINASDDNFCANCGNKKKEIHPEQSTWLCSCGAIHSANKAFCSKCGRPYIEPPVATPWVCSNCGAENEPDYIFCANCRTSREGEKNDLS